jgi:hypothetical protein
VRLSPTVPPPPSRPAPSSFIGFLSSFPSTALPLPWSPPHLPPPAPPGVWLSLCSTCTIAVPSFATAAAVLRPSGDLPFPSADPDLRVLTCGATESLRFTRRSLPPRHGTRRSSLPQRAPPHPLLSGLKLGGEAPRRSSIQAPTAAPPPPLLPDARGPADIDPRGARGGPDGEQKMRQ